jgi:RHS repeat-associated protein
MLDYYLDGTENGYKMNMTYAYNSDNMLTQFFTDGTGDDHVDFAFYSATIDGLGRLTRGTDLVSKLDFIALAKTHNYTYDALSQLTNWNISSWQYKKNGDMLSRNLGTTQSFTYTGNEMATAGTSSLYYDLNGNQTIAPKDASTSMTLEYNWENKLRSAVASANSISIKYDPTGNRIYKSSVNSAGASAEVPEGDSSVARKYIVDVIGDLPVILMEIDPADMSIKKCYIYANAEILSEHDGGSTASQYYYLHDRLGSVRQVITSVNSVVSVAKTLTYSPFGETIESYGDFYTPWQFTGQYCDSETGQYYLRARQYSPYLSRFTGRDLIAGQFENPLTFHKYLYCLNSPLNFMDPWGLLSIAFYDGKDSKTWKPWIANGKDFEKGASVADFAIDIGGFRNELAEVESSLSIISWYAHVFGQTIDDVFFFDHGPDKGQSHNDGRQELGDMNISSNSVTWGNLGQYLAEDGVFYFMGCYTADGDAGKEYIKNCAKSSGRAVVGLDGSIDYSTWFSPYKINGNMWFATPEGTVDKIGD